MSLNLECNNEPEFVSAAQGLTIGISIGGLSAGLLGLIADLTGAACIGVALSCSSVCSVLGCAAGIACQRKAQEKLRTSDLQQTLLPMHDMHHPGQREPIVEQQPVV